MSLREQAYPDPGPDYQRPSRSRFGGRDLAKVRELIQSYAEAASAAAVTLHGKLGELGVLSEDSYLTGFSSDAFDMAKESGEGLINKETWVDLKDCAE